MRAIKNVISIRAAYLSTRRVAWYPAQLGKSRSKGRRPPSCPPSATSHRAVPHPLLLLSLHHKTRSVQLARQRGTKEREAPTARSSQPIPTAPASASRQSEPRPCLGEPPGRISSEAELSMKTPERRAGDGLPLAPHFKYPPRCAISSPPKARQFALWKQTRWVGGIKMRLWGGGGRRDGAQGAPEAVAGLGCTLQGTGRAVSLAKDRDGRQPETERNFRAQAHTEAARKGTER